MDDSIFIENIKVLTLIGVLPFERVKKQTLHLSLVLEGDFSKAMLSDSLDDAISYAQVVEAVEAFADKAQYQLLESFAYHLLRTLFEQFAMIQAIELKVEKRGALSQSQQVGIRIYRKRGAVML